MYWFPGLFTISELQEMDVRVSAYWIRQTKIKALEQQVRMMQAARAGQATEKSYRQMESGIRQEMALQSLMITRKEIIRRNWEDLRQIASRK